ncbi:MAG: hypothetical protein ACE5H8_15060 [Alphaproteobacteria bacterium]
MRFGIRLATAVVAIVLAAPVHAAMTADEVAKAIRDTFDIKVLKVTPFVEDGRAAYLVTVMNPGGNSNSAFQVGRIAVDAETGALISQFRHLPSGYVLSGAPRYGSGPGRPDAAENGIVWR